MIAQRIALGILLLWAVSVLIFAGTQILPGDVATAMLGQQATPEAVANIREELGLDRPAVGPLLRLARRRAAGRFRQELHEPPGHRDEHRQAARQHALPRRRRRGRSPCRSPSFSALLAVRYRNTLLRPLPLDRDALDGLAAGVLRRLSADPALCGEAPLVPEHVDDPRHR